MPTLTHHDQSRFEVFCYSGVAHSDEVTGRFKKLDVIWRECSGLTDAELASLIHADGIDILIDIALHMQGSRLLTFARKPAPVQVTWLGYPGTTGLQSMDYRLTDPYIDPAGEGDAFYSEKSFRLPETFWCYAPLEATLDVSPLPALESGHVTFGCFNNFQKVTDETLDLWAAVLKTLPDTRLIMLSQPGSHRERVLRRLQGSGVDPQRITFQARVPNARYFALFNDVDLCLDTTPYPGHTTTLDSLWMGVPVITLAGQTSVSRGGVSILSNLGLPYLIAAHRDAYVAIAQTIAGDLGQLSRLRQTLRGRMKASPLMDAPRFAAHLEDAYLQIWDATRQ